MLFVVDFDGTLSLRDSVDALLERFAPAAWHAIETEWVEGRITARECMRRQVDLIEGEEEHLERFFQRIQLDPAFPDFLEQVRPFARVAIVSDGLGRAIHTALKQFGLHDFPVFANRLVHEAGRWSLDFAYASATCLVGSGVCKCAVADGLRVDAREPVILIGDGRSDQCIAGRADYVFAKDSLARFCEREGISFTEFASFQDINQSVAAWHQERVAASDELKFPLSL